MKGRVRRKSYTKYRILKLLKENDRMTITEVANALDLSRSSIYTLMNYYRRQYIIRPCGLKGVGRGKKAKVWELTGRGEKELERLREFYGFE